jgi:hypothetical protein
MKIKSTLKAGLNPQPEPPGIIFLNPQPEPPGVIKVLPPGPCRSL